MIPGWVFDMCLLTLVIIATAIITDYIRENR